MDLNAIIPWISIAVAIATFFIGRQSAAKNTGEKAGAIDTKMDHLTESNARLERQVMESNSRMERQVTESNAKIERRMEEMSKQLAGIAPTAARAEEVAKAAHKRLDEHLKRDHGQTVVRG